MTVYEQRSLTKLLDYISHLHITTRSLIMLLTSTGASCMEIDYLVPPLRFSTVEPRFHRGSYPRKTNFPFLKLLQLKTLVSLTPNPITKDTDPALYDFAQENNVELVHLECAPPGKGKKRGVPLDYTTILHCLNLIIHKKHSPIYVHCINGGQVTLLLVACLRKLQFWSSITIFNEFINFAASITVSDRKFVDGFSGEIKVEEGGKVDWLWIGMSKGVVEGHPNIRVALAG